jgi:hypothetical protein
MKKSLQKGITTLLEASHDHLPVTPPSHHDRLEVRGFVVGKLTTGWNDALNNTPIEKFVKNYLGIDEKNKLPIKTKEL